MRLDGKVALITGGGSGIGRESALLFAREGAAIVVVDVDDRGGEETVALVRAAGGRARLLPRRRQQRRRLRADGRRSPSGSSASWTCSSTTPASCTREDDDAMTTDEAVWDLTMNVNAKGVFLGCKYGIPALRRAGGGSIINTASFVAVLGRRHAADRLHREQGRGAGADARAGRHPRPRKHPRERALPRPAAHRAADEVPQHRRRRSSGGWCTFRWAASARRGRSPRRRCSSPRTSRRSSPAPSSWSTAASPRPT